MRKEKVMIAEIKKPTAEPAENIYICTRWPGQMVRLTIAGGVVLEIMVDDVEGKAVDLVLSVSGGMSFEVSG